MNTSASPLRCFHASNLLTYGSLLASIAAIAFAVQNRAGIAGALIAAAVVMDSFDGRFARLFARAEDQRALGGQLDSLADAVSFGLAPAMCMVMLRWRPASTFAEAPADWSAGWSGGITPVVELLWWTSVFLYVACAISRLAFYNVTHLRNDGFIGLPAPVAALIWTTLLLMNPGITASTVVFAITAVAMVLPLPIPRPRGLSFAAFVFWPLAVIALHVASST